MTKERLLAWLDVFMQGSSRSCRSIIDQALLGLGGMDSSGRLDMSSGRVWDSCYRFAEKGSKYKRDCHTVISEIFGSYECLALISAGIDALVLPS